MAVISYSLVRKSNRYIVATWANMANGDTGQPIELVDLPDRSAQVVGTFGVGGNCDIEGSNDGSNYSVISDPYGNALSFTAAGLKQVMDISGSVRPHITAGTGSTSISVSMVFRG